MSNVSSIPDEELLKRAVINARPKKKRQPRWTGVMEMFGLGSTYSCQLCRRFGLDPEEVV